MRIKKPSLLADTSFYMQLSESNTYIKPLELTKKLLKILYIQTQCTKSNCISICQQ